MHWDNAKGILTIDYEDPKPVAVTVDPPAGPRLLKPEDFAPPPGAAAAPAIADVLTAEPAEGSTALNEQIDYGKTMAPGNMSNQNAAE